MPRFTVSSFAPRRIGAASLAITGTALLGLTPAISGFAAGAPTTTTTPVTLAGSAIAEIIGGSGMPIPQQQGDYIADVTKMYIAPPGGPLFAGQPVFPGFTSQGLFTPEGLSPLYTDVKSLPLDPSVAQGQAILDQTILSQVGNGNPDGNDLLVFGYSQSATIASLEMRALAGMTSGAPAAGDLHFVMIGDPSNPDGGLLERFDGLTLPSLGVTFSGATPADSPYETAIYSIEYDGFADFPKYPLNLLADLNAFAGIEYLHPIYYPDPTSVDPGTAVKVATTGDYHGNTDYFMIPTRDLPLLEPLRAIPVIGNPLADLLQPDLTQLVNLGYDNPDNQGWDAGQGNVATPFGLFPSMGQVMTAIGNLGPGAQQGLTAAVGDLQTELSNPSSLFSGLTSGTGASPAPGLPDLTDVVNAVTKAVSDGYSVLLPTADILTAVGITLPSYDLSLFADNLANPIDAVGLPIAASTGLITLAAGIEFMAISNVAQDITNDLSGLTGS